MLDVQTDNPLAAEFQQVANAFLQQKDPNRFKQLRPVVPVEEWIKDPYYLGEVANDLYPFWRSVVIEFFNGGYNEIILYGAMGTGKTWAAGVIALRKLYVLSCYDPIPRYLGLGASSIVMFIYLSISLKLATNTGFGKFVKMIDAAPYFREHFRRNKDKVTQLEFRNKDVIWAPGSSIDHFRGGDLFDLIFDESNFKKGKDKAKFQAAKDIYNESSDRRRTRFKNKERDLSSSTIVSSVETQTSFTEERIEEGRRHPKECLIVHSTTWQVKPDEYSGTKFWVFKGNEFLEPFIGSDKAKLANYFQATTLKPCTIEELPTDRSFDWIQIPVEYALSFTGKDIRSALANIAGIVSGSIDKLFSNKELFTEAFPASSADQHPFTREKVTVSYLKAGRVENYLKKLPKDKDGLVVNPYFSDDYLYFVHIDQSLSGDETGLSIAHPDDDGIIHVDLMLKIVPPDAPDQISIRKVREFIFWLQDNWNMNVGLLTYDQYASAESIQEAQNAGMDCERLSIDKDSAQYDLLADLILRSRIRGYYYEPFEEELFNLEKDRVARKVDHPADGSKDVSDGVAGAVWNAYKHYQKYGSLEARFL